MVAAEERTEEEKRAQEMSKNLSAWYVESW